MALIGSEEIARRVTADLGREVTSEEVRTYLLVGVYPERLSEEDRRDMQATLFKELDGGVES